MPWIVEPPANNSALMEDSCRIVEVDENGQFQRVIAKLDKSITSGMAAVFASSLDMFFCIKKISVDIEYRTYPDEDDDSQSENDIVLDAIEENVDSMLEYVNDLKPE